MAPLTPPMYRLDFFGVFNLPRLSRHLLRTERLPSHPQPVSTPDTPNMPPAFPRRPAISDPSPPPF
eukprot:3221961-Rhodomonas_salina.1